VLVRVVWRYGLLVQMVMRVQTVVLVRMVVLV